MPELRRRLNGVLSSCLPEKQLALRSGEATRTVRLTPLVQLTTGGAGLVLFGWLAVASASLVLDLVGADAQASQVVVQDAYEARLTELAAERDQRAAEAYSAQNRFQIAMEEIGRQQSALLQSVDEQRELATALDLMRARLQETLGERDEIAAANARLTARIAEANAVEASSGTSEADRAQTLQAVSDALAEAVVVRDTATADREALAEELATLEMRTAINAQRQNEMTEALEQAVKLSFEPLQEMFESTGLDVDSLLASIRQSYSGQGGPLVPVGVSTRSFDPGISSRLDALLIDLDRMNLLRIAAGKAPYALPVAASHRFTSPFGRRNDPTGRGRRMHQGIDLAAPMGTPIYATADGEVIAAGREGAYGNVVRIKHAFGFETLYAHQSKLRVKKGQQVSRGEHIGDMGSTGRSTGVHLHYEVRLNGEPVNPMTYLEASKHVFQEQAAR